MGKIIRKYVPIDTSAEHALATRIMSEIITPAMEQKPDLNLCMVRQFCEGMHRFEGNYPEEVACDTAEAAPMTSNY